MTAGVVVMNASALALAADSAVSIPYDAGSRTKTYTRARKILSLHETQPLAVMIWDAPDFCGLPWEVIAADFRTETNSRFRFTSLDQLVETFFEFVDAQAPRWTTPEPERTLIKELLTPVFEQLENLLETRLHEDRKLNVDEAAEIVARAATAVDPPDQWGEEWTGCNREKLAALKSAITGVCAGAAPILWKNLKSEMQEQIHIFASQRLTHVSDTEQGSTGMIFVGYGSGDWFAQARQWRVSGRLASQARRVWRGDHAISADNPSEVVPVAQMGVMQAFLDGLHPDVDAQVKIIIKSLVDDLGGPHDDRQKTIDEVEQKFRSVIDTRGDEVLRGIRFFPAEDLATFAGDLIRMVALRNQATMTPDTVGGPIDVVVLSRHGRRTLHRSDGVGLATIWE